MSCPRSFLPVLATGVLIAFSAGCATRGYVRSQVEELRGSVDAQVSQMQKDLAEVRNTSEAAMARAEEAFGTAGENRDLALGKSGFHEVTQSTVYFAFNSDELSGDAKAILDTLSGQIMERPDLLVDIYGFTDTKGSDHYNYELGQRRANVALRYLATRTPGQLHRYAAVSFGNAQSAGDSTNEARAQARRTVVSLIERIPIPTQPPQADLTER